MRIFSYLCIDKTTMSQFNIYISLEHDYLSQWFANENGGQMPVQLPRGSVESKILELWLTTLPEGSKPQLPHPGDVAIAIPTFRNRPAEVYNYLPQYAHAAIVNIIRARFDVQLWQDLHTFGNIGKEQKELIYAWMEAHGIAPDAKNWDAIAKRYQRLRKAYAARNRAKKSYSKKNRIDLAS